MKIPAGFKTARKQGEVYARDLKKAARLIEQVMVKTAEQEGRIKQVINEVQLLTAMLKAWVSGEYRQLPLKTVAAVLAGFIYFVNPLDMLPDAIAGLGYLDDITVLSFVINSIRQDLERYQKWKGERETELPPNPADNDELFKEGEWRELNE